VTLPGGSPNCPHCGSIQTRPWGTNRNGSFRFRCADCWKTFSNNTRQANNWIGADRTKRLLACYLAGYSIRLGARLAEVNKQTAKRYYARFRAEYGASKCPCGQLAGHLGWCNWRLQQSKRRSMYLKRIGHFKGLCISGLYDLPPLPPRFKRRKNKSEREDMKWLKQAKIELRNARIWLASLGQSPLPKGE